MTVAGYVVIVLGLALILASLALGNITDARGTAPNADTRFARDAALFGARVAGATLILFGAVIVIASHHAAGAAAGLVR